METISRRKLLASLGAAGAALATGGILNAGSGAVYAQNGVTGNVYDQESSKFHWRDLRDVDFCVKTTLAELRGGADSRPDDVYFVADSDKQGFFVYDPADTGPSVIANNVSDGYHTGVNIVASESGALPPDTLCDMTIVGNTFTKTNTAVQLWPVGRNSLRNVTVSNNTISVSNLRHHRNRAFGIGSNQTSAIPGGVDIENITIQGNTITFDEELVSRSNFREELAGGICLPTSANVKNVVISNNVIRNSPITGIRVGNDEKTGTVSNVLITGNMVINAGHYPTTRTEYKAGIHLRSNVTAAKISNNVITETYDTVKGEYAIRANDQDGNYTNVQVTDNFVHVNNGQLPNDLSPSIDVI